MGNNNSITVSQIAELIQQNKDGRITRELFQGFLDNPTGVKSANKPDFSVTIDYTQSLAGMIEAGKYDWKNTDITSENFPIVGTGKMEVELKLIHLKKAMTTKQIEEHLEKLGLVSAKIEHLLAFGEKYSEEQRKFPIVALGSVWVRPGGSRFVSCLGSDGSGRFLCLGWDDPGSGWSGTCRFLVLSK